MEGLNFVRDGAGGRPGNAHRDVERVARNKVGDRNGRVQACREKLLIDLETRVGSKAGGSQQLRVCADVKLADKDIGPAKCLFIESRRQTQKCRYSHRDSSCRSQLGRIGHGTWIRRWFQMPHEPLGRWLRRQMLRGTTGE